MAQIVKDHRGLVTIVEYGQTYEKRTISLLKVSLNSYVLIWHIEIRRILECIVLCVFVIYNSLIRIDMNLFPDWSGYWREKESYLDGLWNPRQGMDRPGLLPVLCQTGKRQAAISKTFNNISIKTFCSYPTYHPIYPMFLFAPSNQILQAYKTDPTMKEMMKNMDFYVTPVLNIDGYIYSWKDNTVSACI